ncbi:hypothetical protein QA596_07200 [Balneolales bacterium ANBcel1]|nr:hypothetical protein [Balneolales bacterium ANBcel1]
MTRISLICTVSILLLLSSCSEPDSDKTDEVSSAVDAPVAGTPQVVASGDGLLFMAPIWSPDGSLIAFTSGQYRGLWVVRPDGSDLAQITDAESAGYRFQWAPDNTAITARIARYDGPERYFAIASYHIETGSKSILEDFSRASIDPPAKPVELPRDFGEQTALNATFSPDSTKIAFQLMGDTVYVMTADQPKSPPDTYRQLGQGEQPVWMPDGEHIIVTVSGDDGHHITESDLYAVHSESGERILLTGHTDLIALQPDISPDGRHLVFSCYNSGNIYIMELLLP